MSIDTKQKSAFKEKLEGEKKTLLEELGALGKRNPTTNDWDAIPEENTFDSDENDRADRAEQFELDTSIVRTLESKLNSVEAALKKLEESPEKFGLCEVCGKEIESKRLEANASATTCIEHMK